MDTNDTLGTVGTTRSCISRVPNLDPYRTMFGVIFTVATAIALFDLITVTVILTLLKRARKLPVYKLLNFLNISQMIHMIPTVIIMLPCTFTSCPFYSDTVIIVISTLETFGYYAASILNCLIAIERISVFLCATVHHFVEVHPHAYTSIAWIGGLFVVILTSSIGCYKRFNSFTLRFTYDCGTCTIFYRIDLLTIFMWFTQITVIIMLIGYIIVFLSMKIKMRIIHTNRKLTGREAQLVLQGTLICTCHWLDAFSFFLLPIVLGNNKEAAILDGLIGIINAAIQPLILIIFNKAVREGFHALFGISKARPFTIINVKSEAPDMIRVSLFTRTQHKM